MIFLSLYFSWMFYNMVFGYFVGASASYQGGIEWPTQTEERSTALLNPWPLSPKRFCLSFQRIKPGAFQQKGHGQRDFFAGTQALLDEKHIRSKNHKESGHRFIDLSTLFQDSCDSDSLSFTQKSHLCCSNSFR